jgi:hypothetical protein
LAVQRSLGLPMEAVPLLAAAPHYPNPPRKEARPKAAGAKRTAPASLRWRSRGATPGATARDEHQDSFAKGFPAPLPHEPRIHLRYKLEEEEEKRRWCKHFW